MLGKIKNIFKRFRSLLGGYEFHFFVLLIYFLILSWPYMASWNNKSILFSFAYYFSAWIALVVILLISNVIGGDNDIENND